MRYAIITALLLTTNAHAATVALKGTVVAVHDGDTFKLKDGTSIRVDGIDAPELKQPFGDVAQQALSAMILGKDVACKVKGKSYNRIVARCTVDGADIGAAMVASGAAWNAPEFGDRYRYQQRDAACGHKGLWADIGPVLPRDWRRCKNRV